MGEAERREARGRVGVVAQGASSLFGWGPVVAQAIGLDDQTQFGPEELNRAAGPAARTAAIQ